MPNGIVAKPVRAFRKAIVGPEVPVREVPDVSFGDLVRMLAEGIADAQASLDRASAELLTELAETKISIIPRVTETVAEDGSVEFERAPPQEVSLLELGVMPTFYQFSKSTVEVSMDLKVVERTQEEGTGRRRYGLFAGTSRVRAERRLNRDVSVSSKLTATLVPVARPLRLDPVRNVVTPEPE